LSVKACPVESDRREGLARHSKGKGKKRGGLHRSDQRRTAKRELRVGKDWKKKTIVIEPLITGGISRCRKAVAAKSRAVEKSKRSQGLE